jgi:PTS system beta-glucosides-specific IIC component
MLEHWVDPKIPDTFRAIGTPFVCAAIMVPLTITVIGPISTVISNGLATGYNFLYEAVPWLASAVLAFFWQVLVIFGVHWSFTPISLANFSKLGYDVMQPCMQVAVCAQTAACFGAFWKSKNSQVKNVSASAAATGLFGITEPAIYGVTLRFKKPFFCGCAAAAVGGVIISLFRARYFVYAGLTGFLSIPNAIYDASAQANCVAAGTADASYSNGIIGILIGTLVAVVLAFVLVQIVGFDDPVEIPPEAMEDTPETEAPAVEAAGIADTELFAPLNGEAVELSQVPDEAFASGILGKGVAILPSEGKLYSPVDGTVSSVFETKHAVCIETATGAEILIHVGLDTVQLGGKYFEAKVSDGQKVKKGDLLLEFDLEQISKEYKTYTPILVTNADDFASFDLTKTSGAVSVGDPIYTAKA